MKRFLAVLLSLISLLCVLAGCGSKSYVGNYYSKEAKAMDAEAILSIYDENNEQVFEIEYLYKDGSSILVHGTYEEISDRKLKLKPEKKIIMMGGIPAETPLDDDTPIEANIKGDIISLGDGATYIKEGSKTAETDTTVKATKKAETEKK